MHSPFAFSASPFIFAMRTLERFGHQSAKSTWGSAVRCNCVLLLLKPTTTKTHPARVLSPWWYIACLCPMCVCVCVGCCDWRTTPSNWITAWNQVSESDHAAINAGYLLSAPSRRTPEDVAEQRKLLLLLLLIMMMMMTIILITAVSRLHSKERIPGQWATPH